MAKFVTTAIAVVLAGLATVSSAEIHEVRMMNRSEEGRMVFEPSFLRVDVGDTVRFLVTDKGHNAETVKTMVPAGVEGFKGAINEEVEFVFQAEGFYGVKCKPHYNMGMVMTVAVGAETLQAPEGFLEGRIPKKAVQRFTEQLSKLAID
ncbi:pseudoazurin [Parasedimentitalea maritima]|uniref:Pseudoazurin n=1 Tax=Parasedimentitalea maritima TaxID=2578117 RepID=A0A6A4RGZ6_9RHOB|nr:pseudoazurin [Zongyanglinia marina]KAE9630351.1 pseudoazurin [Zongyanglinia marina]